MNVLFYYDLLFYYMNIHKCEIYAPREFGVTNINTGEFLEKAYGGNVNLVTPSVIFLRFGPVCTHPEPKINALPQKPHLIYTLIHKVDLSRLEGVYVLRTKKCQLKEN